MKLLYAILFIITAGSSFAQIKLNPTTEEEYNYMTKGYRVQIESGLDMKKGYLIQDITQPDTQGNYTYQFKMLVREQSMEVAGIIAVTKSKVSGKTYYFGLPVNNPELLGRYWNDLFTWDMEILRPYAYVLSYYYANMTAQAEEFAKGKR